MFAIDDTGHERLNGQPIYGLGGCAIMGRDYYQAIREPWTRRRAETTENFGGRLRAADFGRRATPANMAAMWRFFASQPFYRFAAVATLTTEYPREQELIAAGPGVMTFRRCPGCRVCGACLPRSRYTTPPGFG
jgi:hypothetical protein